MKNILLKIEYDGTGYKGWQTQRFKSGASLPAKVATIQQSIEGALSIILQKKISIAGSGRTDSGVHAKEQVANFKINTDIPISKIKKSLNSLLPRDIIIKQIKYVDLEFHARFSAKSKLYRYTILNRSYGSAFLKNYVFHCVPPLNAALMAKEAGQLKGTHDFRSFQASDKKPRSSIRTIKKISVKTQDDLIFIDIQADGFLYNMVRNIAGTLVEIGRGKMPKGTMKKLLDVKDRTFAGPTAPASGLCLIKVMY
ncbi:MAG: tRNA pseudouridine(38-40) synthase TruA [Candidatus Omnitrophota bacterium]